MARRIEATIILLLVAVAVVLAVLLVGAHVQGVFG